jgi:ornithine decarboxylase
VKPIPSIETIAELINKELRHFGPEVQVIAEPGRYLVSDAGYFICRVVGTATRNDQRWMYWDAGVFGGVIETTEGCATTSIPIATASPCPGTSRARPATRSTW